MDARQALADALSAEMDTEITPELMQGVDVILTRLWLQGFRIMPLPEPEMADAD
jgi:hypothetical protein